MQGLITVARVTSDGKIVSTQQAVDRGWIKPGMAQPSGWGLAKEEVPIGFNMTVDGGRQALAYLFGGRSLAAYACSKFAIGTGTTAPNASDVALEAMVADLSGGHPLKDVGMIDWPSEFVARVELVIPQDNANGLLITEFGLFASPPDQYDSGTLLCRKVDTGIPKSSAFSPTLLWRVRF